MAEQFVTEVGAISPGAMAVLEVAGRRITFVNVDGACIRRLKSASTTSRPIVGFDSVPVTSHVLTAI